MQEERPPFPGKMPIPGHVPAELVRSFDFWCGLGDRPQERIAELHKGPRLFYSPDLHHPLRKAPGAWIVTRAEDVRTVFGNPQIFSSQEYDSFASSIGERWRLSPLEVDPPHHSKVRTLLNPIFSPKRMAEIEPRIRAWCVELIEQFQGRRECEFVGEFAKHFPTGIFIDMMGLPRELLGSFMDWENRLLSGRSSEERVAALRELLAYLRATIAERRAAKTNDVIGSIVEGRIDGQPLSDDEIVGICVLLYTAGLDTVVNSLGFIFRHLAENPDLQTRLRENRDLISGEVEELLRLYSPVTPQRIALQDTELAGVKIKAGDLLTVSLAAASRDPAEAAAADSATAANPAAARGPHFAFGFGIHRCLGAPLARRDIWIALNEWLTRMPPFRMKEGSALRTIGGSVLALDRLPLCW
jgi:cytochrome P450